MQKLQFLIPNRKELQKKYDRLMPVYEEILNQIYRRIHRYFKDIGKDFIIRYRLKSFESFYQKILRRQKELNVENYADIPLTDLLGIRIICAFLEDIDFIEKIIKKHFKVLEIERKGLNFSFKEFGYESTHILLEIPQDLFSGQEDGFTNVCEIQLRTILQDAWAEVEHELIYKHEFTPFDEPLKRKLAALNANLTLSDIIFQEIRDYERQLHEQLKTRRNSFIEKLAEKQIHAPDLIEANSPELEGERLIYDNEITEMETIDSMLLKALYAHNSNNFQEAINIYSKILKVNPQSKVKAMILIHRGMAFFAESDYKKAILDFSDALSIDEKNAKAFYYRGIVKKITKDYGGALEDLSNSIYLDQFQFEPVFNRAQLYFHLGDYTNAYSDMELAVNLDSDSIQAKDFFEVCKQKLKM